METSIQHGEIVFLHELPALLQRLGPGQAKAVRVLGRCVGVAPRERRVGLADRSMAAMGAATTTAMPPQGGDGEVEAAAAGSVAAIQGAQLLVDTTLLPDLAFALDSLYQVIGELQQPQPPLPSPSSAAAMPVPVPVLRARVARCVDGMDVTLYEQAIRIRRTFLQRSGLALAAPHGEAAAAAAATGKQGGQGGEEGEAMAVDSAN